MWLPWQPITDAIIMLTFTRELSAVHGGRTILPLPKSANPAAARGRAGEHDDYLLQMDFFFFFSLPTFCDYPESIRAPAAGLACRYRSRHRRGHRGSIGPRWCGGGEMCVCGGGQARLGRLSRSLHESLASSFRESTERRQRRRLIKRFALR